MEAELRDLQSPVLQKEVIQKVLGTLSEAVTEAAAIRDKKQVDDPELRKALSIVEAFLRKRGRICYGGMAINAHLPKSLKFYDFASTLPDYDFFTPDPEGDIDELISRFKTAGFEDVSARVGMHEGTTKIFVNYVGVADITYIPYWLNTILRHRSIIDDGIHYADADYLRMNMYLELARPMGEVERWDKVYKRLVLLNAAKPPHMHSCKKKKHWKKINMNRALHEDFITYCAKNHLIFAGAELKRVYSNPKTDRAGYLLKSQNPVVAYAENPGFHIPILRQLIHQHHPQSKLHHIRWKSLNGFTPEMHGLKLGDSLLLVLVEIDYCQSYTHVELPGNLRLPIASLDSAILLWYQMSYLKGMEGLVGMSNHCFADALVDVSIRTRDANKAGVFDSFQLQCTGHQPSKASLLRAKQERIKSLKQRRKRSRSTLKKHSK
jgi:hypothetical protein